MSRATAKGRLSHRSWPKIPPWAASSVLLNELVRTRADLSHRYDGACDPLVASHPEDDDRATSQKSRVTLETGNSVPAAVRRCGLVPPTGPL